MAAACLLAASPALAAHHEHGGGGGGGGTHVQRTVHVQRGSVNNGNAHVTRSVRTTHVNVIRGGHERSRTVTRMNTTRTVHGRSVRTHSVSVRSGNGHARAAVNVRAFRRNFTAPHRYHFGTYRRPGGWYAHRWVYGERVPHGWYGRDYWIGNYITFGLIAPPDGYQWVRVGDDALLIDVDTGEVLQVEYGVFY
jgi:Ni/Co efflux regulator RcnB